MYTGIRVSELIRLKIQDVDFDRCQLQFVAEKGKKDRIVPFPKVFKHWHSMFIMLIKSIN